MPRPPTGYKPPAKVMPTIKKPAFMAPPAGGGSLRTAATNMGPKGFTGEQKAMINARMKKKAATVIKAG